MARVIPMAVFIFLAFAKNTYAQQVTAKIDTTGITIGEQINYQIEVEADTTDLVMFPEGQTFSPLEVIESYKTDTSFAAAKYKLIKKYGLTQFDSGTYTIPRQRIIINERPFMTDSMRVEVANVAVDTTKQKLYDIKNIIEVEKAPGHLVEYLLWILAIIAVVGIFLFFIIRRSKKKAAAERRLPPFEQAITSLHQLDEEFQAQDGNSDPVVTKTYYSRLTDIVRKYLVEEHVYDRSMESTSSELIERLHEERAEGKIELSRETIHKLEEVLRRADLTKFARTLPMEGQAHADRVAMEQVVKETKESLPEPTEEELLRDEEYRKAKEAQRKRRLIITGILGTVGILVISLGILIAIKGFDYVKDNLIGHPSKELLEGDWVRSEYGVPPMIISTPKVLKRFDLPLPQELQGKAEMSSFMYGSLFGQLYIIESTTRFGGQQEIDPQNVVNGSISMMESQGAKNMVVKNEKFTTPNGAEGLKTFGSAEFPNEKDKESFEKGEYTILTFTAKGILQQLIIVHKEDDKYAKQIVERIINSVELQNQNNQK
ncbi:MAG: hypothetical protein CL868_07560 [Cytophagaceae bacterium]|nr:hypothetical protein [Cytophagaceae bacterium]